MSSLLAASGLYALSQSKFGQRVITNTKSNVQNVIDSLRSGAQSNAVKRAGKKQNNLNKLVKPKGGVSAGTSQEVNTTVKQGNKQQSVKMDIAPFMAQVDAKYRPLADVVEAHEEAIDDLSERQDQVEANLATLTALVGAESDRMTLRSRLIDGGLLAGAKSLVKLLNLGDTPVNTSFRFLAGALEEAINFGDLSDEDRKLAEAFNMILYVASYYDPARGLASLMPDTAATTTTTTTSATTSADPFAAL